jgi:hypothetical protein
MRKVVYLLGAGFSAPLGLPVISNFYWKAKDLYDREPKQFGHFARSFEVMESFHRVKMFMNAELENIEEILSILEMKDLLSSDPNRETFSQFIADVIKAYTPSLSSAPMADPRPHDFAAFFGSNSVLSSYCIFVSQLFGVRAAQWDNGRWSFLRGEPPIDYSVVSLNYDSVLEGACAYMSENYSASAPMTFYKPMASVIPPTGSVMLSKVHGSVDTEIVPPTWNKRIHEHILPAWRAAFEAVSKANELRFIGYSLPETDSYFRYFLKAAISRSFNLQRVDVLCSADVQQRYASLFESKRLHFRPGRTEDYLRDLANRANVHFSEGNPPHRLSSDLLEAAHQHFFPH